MDTLTTSYSRIRRSTAGINKRYDEQDYVLVSFPQLNKHSIIPAASVNIDPLDKQNGSIKTFGSRKNLRIIGSGPKEVMKERASRYAASAGSEEIELVPDEQENDENQDDDDDEYSLSPMHRSTKKIKKRTITSEQSKSQIEITSSNRNDQTTTTSNYECFENASSFNKTPLNNRQLNFERVYSSKTGTKRSYEDNIDESSLSGSEETDDGFDKNVSIVEKNNQLPSLLKKPRRKRKKQTIEPIRDVEGPCSGCIKLEKELMEISKRLGRLEKVVPVIKKFRVKAPVTSTNQTNVIEDINKVYAAVKEVTGVDPNELRSTTTRPTMIMRELMKKAGHVNDKVFLKNHENIFKEFIQMKCMILDENMKDQWEEITDSLSRQHIDIENNKKKKIHPEPLSTSSNTIQVQLTQTSTTHDEQEEASLAPPSTTTTSESSQSL